MERNVPVWIDCDPGHDDAVMLLMAFFGVGETGDRAGVRLEVLGVSTVAGNAPGSATHINAAKLLTAFEQSPSRLPLFRGADEPLVRQTKRTDSAIHGEDGLGGVEGLPSIEHPTVREFLLRSPDGPNPLALVTHQIALLRSRVALGKRKLSLLATGPLTNIALLLKLAPPELIRAGVSQIVVMGGAFGVPGNRSPLAEFNILVDPEAAKVVFDYDIPVIAAGLNVTHKALFTDDVEEALENEPSIIGELLVSAMTFFRETYLKEFGFEDPPVHDLLVCFYLLAPELFNNQWDEGPKRYRVDVVTADGPALGATVADFHEQLEGTTDTWGKGGRNVMILEHLTAENLQQLWRMLVKAKDRADPPDF